MVQFDDLRSLLSRGASDKQTLYHAIQRLPHPSELPADIVDQIVDLVPKISELLSLSTQISSFREYHYDLVPQVDDLVDGELNDYFLHIESKICRLLAHLGTRAQAAVPALLAHVERHPQFKHNTWAIGKIGGPGVVRHLIKWTDFQGPYEHDEQRYESVCDAIRCLGVPAIQELLTIASPSNDDAHDKTIALLNLVENTAYPPRLSIPLIASELERLAGVVIDPMYREMLRECLIGLGHEYAHAVVAAIEPRLLSAKSAAADDFIHVLAELGTVAIPLLKKAVEESVNAYVAIDALVKIGGEGLDYVYTIIATSNNQPLVGRAVRSIPLNEERSLEVLEYAIERSEPDWKSWRLVRRMAVRRLREFTDHQVAISAYWKHLRFDPEPTFHFLGEPAIQELIDTACSSNDDADERKIALLKLVQNSDYPPDLRIPLIASELNCIAEDEMHARSRELLRDCLIWLGADNAQLVVTAIEPWLLSARSEATADFIHVLSELGAVAIPSLKIAVELSGNGEAAIDALVKIGGEGLEYVFSFVTTSQSKKLLPHTVRSIPLDDIRSLEVLGNAIEAWRANGERWGLLRRMTVRRLGEFNEYQEAIISLLRSFHDDPDDALVKEAEVTINKIVDKANHQGQ